MAKKLYEMMQDRANVATQMREIMNKFEDGVMDAEKMKGRELWRTYSATTLLETMYPPRLARDLLKVPMVRSTSFSRPK